MTRGRGPPAARTSIPIAGGNTGTLTFDSNGQCQAPNFVLRAVARFSQRRREPPELHRQHRRHHAIGRRLLHPCGQPGRPAYGNGWTSYSIDKNGLIIGQFSNGMTQNLGQIAVAVVNNPDGLTKVGGSLYGHSPNSGTDEHLDGRQGGCGTIAGGNLELSNVDLAQEFANLIITQRGYQANSQVITTSDQMLQDVVNLKR